MNTDVEVATTLTNDVCRLVGDLGSVNVALCPPNVYLGLVACTLKKTQIRLGAQNMHPALSGAYTGEVSGPMLVSVGCYYVILGHSERRQYFGETDASVNEKVHRAISVGLSPIICVGEVLAERKAGKEREVVSEQVLGALRGVDDPSSLVIAYEPVWAIGTGETATPDQAQSMHAHIRSLLSDKYGKEAAASIEILYGGSMKPSNAAELLGQSDVDGGLIGGASLKTEAFAAIVSAGKEAVQ